MIPYFFRGKLRKVEIHASRLSFDSAKEILHDLNRDKIFIPIQLQCPLIARGRFNNRELSAAYRPQDDEQRTRCRQHYDTCDLINM